MSFYTHRIDPDDQSWGRLFKDVGLSLLIGVGFIALMVAILLLLQGFNALSSPTAPSHHASALSLLFFNIFCYLLTLLNARIAQLVEHTTDTREVLGSTPSARTSNKNLNCFRFLETGASRSHVFVVTKTGEAGSRKFLSDRRGNYL